MVVSSRSIGLVAPTVEVAQRAKDVARELDMLDSVIFRVGNHVEGVEIARRLEEEGVEVLVSRRSTAVLIEEKLKTPNISIPITLQDVAQAFHEVKKVTGLEHPQVGFFAMPSAQTDIESFGHYLNFDLRIYPVTPDEDYLALMVDRAIADKMNIIVAGTVATVFANERHFPCLLMDSGPVAIRKALLEARQVASVRELEKTRAEHFRIVVDMAYNGILVVNAEQAVQVANPAAHDILQRPGIDIGSSVHALMPELDLSPCFQAGQTLRSIFLPTASGPLVLDATPTLVGNAVRGAVISFQPAERVTELGATTRQNLYSEGFSSRYSLAAIIGSSTGMLRAKALACEYAAGTGSVLLAGETGTGKELFAHAIHGASARGKGPFIPINCAAIPSSLLESELFGFEEGAFTGAMRKGKPGLFELAHQGSIFLDEISELSKQAQLRLLRVLQEHCLMRLGGSRLIPIDIRVIAATNKNLWRQVEQGRFRKDLYYRLNTLPLFIPPLRQRQGDVSLLANYFMRQLHTGRSMPPPLKKHEITLLEAHSWPGNVRELQNVVERYALAAGRGQETTLDMEALLNPEIEWAALNEGEAVPLARLTGEQQEERDQIIQVLHRHNGHRGNTATALGMNRTTLFRKMSQYGISG